MSQATAEQAITTVEALSAELRAELVTKREAGTTLAELKKGYPQVAPGRHPGRAAAAAPGHRAQARHAQATGAQACEDGQAGPGQAQAGATGQGQAAGATGRAHKAELA